MIAIYIIVTWTQEGWSQVQMIIGRTADPEFLQKLTFTACQHDTRIQKVILKACSSMLYSPVAVLLLRHRCVDSGVFAVTG